MSFYPCNRHLLVEKINSDMEEAPSTVLLPEDYKPKNEAYCAYRLVADSEDCSLDVELGDVLIAEQSMVKEIKHGGTNYLLVQENYVLGTFSE